MRCADGRGRLRSPPRFAARGARGGDSRPGKSTRKPRRRWPGPAAPGPRVRGIPVRPAARAACPNTAPGTRTAETSGATGCGFPPADECRRRPAGSGTGDAFHLGALEEHLDALGVLVDYAVLALLHLGVIEARVFDVDAVGLGVDEVLPDIGGMEQALGRDASHQETGSAEFGLLFDEGSFQSILAGADSCGVAAGTTPDDDEIVGHFPYSSGRAARGGSVSELHEQHAEFGGGFEDEF